jgi:hypothetical protein
MPFLNLVFIMFKIRNFLETLCIRLLLVPLLALLLIPDFITVSHFSLTFLLLLLIVFRFFLGLLLVLSLKPPSFITSLLFLNHFIGLK